MCLGYPKHAWRKAPRQWCDKRRHVHDHGKAREIAACNTCAVSLFYAHTINGSVFPHTLNYYREYQICKCV